MAPSNRVLSWRRKAPTRVRATPLCTTAVNRGHRVYFYRELQPIAAARRRFNWERNYTRVSSSLARIRQSGFAREKSAARRRKSYEKNRRARSRTLRVLESSHENGVNFSSLDTRRSLRVVCFPLRRSLNLTSLERSVTSEDARDTSFHPCFLWVTL